MTGNIYKVICFNGCKNIVGLRKLSPDVCGCIHEIPEVLLTRYRVSSFSAVILTLTRLLAALLNSPLIQLYATLRDDLV